MALRLNIPALAAIILAAGVAGGVVSSYLPFGAKSMTIERGHAAPGTFQSEESSTTAILPDELTWTDRSGMVHVGSRPACLRAPKGAYVEAKVEAGYIEMRGPDGSSPIVGWIRCL